MLGRRVLLVDDDVDVVVTVRAMLEAGGYEVTTAQSAEEALALLPARFDFAILDLMMEESDAGVRVAQELRGQAETRDIPILLLTGAAERTGFRVPVATQEEREWLGVDAWLDKPVTQELLLAEMERLAAARREAP